MPNKSDKPKEERIREEERKTIAERPMTANGDKEKWSSDEEINVIRKERVGKSCMDSFGSSFISLYSGRQK